MCVETYITENTSRNNSEYRHLRIWAMKQWQCVKHGKGVGSE